MSLLGSCVEIIDDIKINNDGSGTFKYVVNLSWSKVKVNSILALDSLDGRPIPSLDNIKKLIAEYHQKIEEKEGISNVKVDVNYTDFILKFECEFTNVLALQKAIREIVIEKKKNNDFEEINHTWLSWDGAKLVRSVPSLTKQTTKLIQREDIHSLKEGSYSSITRFDRAIDHCVNPNTKVSPSKTACLIKTNPYALINEPSLLENTIFLKKEDKQE